MFVLRKFALVLCALVAVASRAQAAAIPAEAAWQPLLSLNQSDYDQAAADVAVLYGEWALLPDWLEPRAVVIPAGWGGATWLIVRTPYRQPCGGYRYTVFGPVARDGTRAQLGEPLCGGELRVAGTSSPDLLLADPGTLDEPPPTEPKFQRWRWRDTAWLRIVGR